MAFPTTYTAWLAYFKSWLDVDDLSDAQIALGMDMAQQRLNDELDSQWIETSAVIPWNTVVPSIGIQANIADFNRVITVVTDATSQALIPRTIEEFYDYTSTAYNSNVILPAATAYGSLPQSYTISTMGIYIWPTPANASLVTVRYYKTVPLIGGSLDFNEFTLRHPNLFCIAALKEISTFITEDDRGQMFEQQYQYLLGVANRNAKRAKFGLGLQREVPNMGAAW